MSIQSEQNIGHIYIKFFTLSVNCTLKSKIYHLLSSSPALFKVLCLTVCLYFSPWHSSLVEKLSLQDSLRHVWGYYLPCRYPANYCSGLSGALSQQDSVHQDGENDARRCGSGVWFPLCSCQQPRGESDGEMLLSNGSLARCSVAQAIESRLSKCKPLLSHLSYKSQGADNKPLGSCLPVTSCLMLLGTSWLRVRGGRWASSTPGFFGWELLEWMGGRSQLDWLGETDGSFPAPSRQVHHQPLNFSQWNLGGSTP